MAAPTIYRSTDGSAPVLDGNAGSLVNLLDKCLVAGYGSKAAAGWSKPYTGTNQAVFRQGGSGMYLQVDDAAPGAGLGREARWRGFETMSAYATGTGPFPTVAQAANGVFHRKSATADGTARAWILAADDRTFYLFVLSGDSAGLYLAAMFGDIYSAMVADTYKVAIINRPTENSALVTSAVNTVVEISNVTAIQAGHYMPRSYTGFGTAITFGKCGDMSKTGAAGDPNSIRGGMTFPNPTDGGLYLARLDVVHATATVRGRLRGLYHGLASNASVADGDTFDGITGSGYEGRSFLIVKANSTAGGGGYYVVETTAWDTSP